MTFASGYIPDPSGHQVTPIAHHLAKIGAIAPIPRTLDYRPWVRVGPGILDQSITQSCVGHAIVGAISTLFMSLNTPLPRLSPVSVYDFARLIDAPGAPLIDEGCQPNQAFRGINKWGISTWDSRPTDPGTINDAPKLEELESAEGWRFEGDYSIDPDPELLARTISAVGPATTALIVDQAFEDYTGGVYVPGGAIRGGHYVYVVGYDTSLHGSRVFYIANSWTDQWGDGGFAEMSASCVEGWRDMRGLAVRRTS